MGQGGDGEGMQMDARVRPHIQNRFRDGDHVMNVHAAQWPYEL